MNEDMMHESNERADERLHREVAALPREIEPAVDLFPAIRARIESARIVPLGSGIAGASDDVEPHSITPWWRLRRRTSLAAAAVLCVVAGGGSLLLRTTARNLPIAATETTVRDDPRPTLGAPAETPAAAASISADYQMASDDLERVLRARLDHLSPLTAQTIRRSLATIEQALAETRAALEQDPASRELIELLDSVYRQKLTLLRRANALPLRTT